MTDPLHLITKWIDRNRWVTMAIIAAALLCLPSCEFLQSKGLSPISNQSVTTETHAGEWNAFLLTSEQTNQELQQKIAVLEAKREALVASVAATEAASDEFMQRLQDKQSKISAGTAAIWTTIKSVYPPVMAADPLIAPILGILGFGAFVDARRKNKLLNASKTKTA